MVLIPPLLVKERGTGGVVAAQRELTSSVTLQSVGDQILDGDYAVHSRYAACVNLQDQAKLISCTHQLGWAGPIQIIVQGVDLCQLACIGIRDSQMSITEHTQYPPQSPRERGEVHRSADDGLFPPLAGGYRGVVRKSPMNQTWTLPIAAAVIFDSRLELSASAVERLEKNLDFAHRALLECAHEKSLACIFDRNRARYFTSAFETAFFNHVVAGAAMMLQGDVLGGLRSFKGVGFGLTPSGDDFIAGVLLGLHLLQQRYQRDLSALRATIYAATRSCNLLSDTFLDLTCRGRFAATLKNFVGALCQREAAQLVPALQQVLALGSTSGADLLCGLFFALISLKERLLDYRNGR